MEESGKGPAGETSAADMKPMKRDALPYAVDLKELSELFRLGKSTIQRWDAAGMLTRLKGPQASESGKRVPVRYVVSDFLEFLESQPGSRKGNYTGRQFEKLGDVLR